MKLVSARVVESRDKENTVKSLLSLGTNFVCIFKARQFPNLKVVKIT